MLSFESLSKSLRSLSLILSRSFLGVREAEAGNLNDNLGADEYDLRASRCFLSARFSRSAAIDLPSFGPDDVRYMDAVSACAQIVRFVCAPWNLHQCSRTCWILPLRRRVSPHLEVLCRSECVVDTQVACDEKDVGRCAYKQRHYKRDMETTA